ncbi:MAG: hypothetical protein EOP53_06650 [Sphingobacteriales bacterium]|nr:MAG: hypothetical protein EOP53_06650 [Sphingobacteriales bacterium]
MKIYFILLYCCLAGKAGLAQTDKEKVNLACLNYIEGFYEGDTTKLIRSLQPTLYKFGYYKNKDTGKYEADGHMTYRQALDYATRVLQSKRFAKPDAPKNVEVLNISNTTAAAKITAWWGTDYILLSKQQEKWMIEQVLWEGPLAK